MDRIDSPDGLFHEGNPATGTKGTKVTDEWLNSIQEEIAKVIEAAGIVLNANDNTQLLQALGGIVAQAPVSVAVETNLTAVHGIIFVSAAAPIHLPAYDSVVASKRFKLKNIGVDPVVIDAPDAKTIDGQVSITLDNYGDRCEIVKDGANWQTI